MVNMNDFLVFDVFVGNPRTLVTNKITTAHTWGTSGYKKTLKEKYSAHLELIELKITTPLLGEMSGSSSSSRRRRRRRRRRVHLGHLGCL